MAGDEDLSTQGRRRSALSRALSAQADLEDDPLDLGLRAADEHPPPGLAQPAGEHGEVEHERRVGERQPGQVDRQVAGHRHERTGKRAPAQALRRAVLIPPHSKHEILFIA